MVRIGTRTAHRGLNIEAIGREAKRKGGEVRTLSSSLRVWELDEIRERERYTRIRYTRGSRGAIVDEVVVQEKGKGKAECDGLGRRKGRGSDVSSSVSVVKDMESLMKTFTILFKGTIRTDFSDSCPPAQNLQRDQREKRTVIPDAELQISSAPPLPLTSTSTETFPFYFFPSLLLQSPQEVLPKPPTPTPDLAASSRPRETSDSLPDSRSTLLLRPLPSSGRASLSDRRSRWRSATRTEQEGGAAMTTTW